MPGQLSKASQKLSDFFMGPLHIEVESAVNPLKYYTLAKTVSAFVESVPEVTQSKTMMFVRRAERIAYGVQEISNLLAARFIQATKLIDEIGIEMSFKARLRYRR
jgi:hypothetical protein